MNNQDSGLCHKNSAENERYHLRELLNAIKQIKYGSVIITIHNAEIVQIERVEKMRFPSGRDSV
ncbi:MAG: YezD family protein [Candidatus Omnitrophica bacterium]|nr:YezD family protein [Candidatus Omnitrophota bacterium]